MPNDPRIKFKKKVYDPSRNLMYEQRTGGGGGSFPSGGGGGGGGGGGIPWTPVGPSIPVKPVNPVNPVNPYFPSFPIVPTAPFDPYERKLNVRIDEAKMKMRRDAQKYYDRAQRPKIATPKMFDDMPPPSDLPGVNVLVDAPPAPAPSTLPGPSSRLLPGAKPTALSGILGKPPPRIDIKPANLLDPSTPAKIPRVLPSNFIDPQAQGTPREQMEHYVKQERLREEGRTWLIDTAATTLDTRTPLEQKIAAKMDEMRLAGATDLEMVQTAKAMRAQANKLPSPGITAQTPPEGVLAKERMIREELLTSPTTTHAEVIQLKQEIAELDQRIKEIGDRSAAQTLKDTAAKLEVGKSGGSGKSISQRIFDMVKGKPNVIADLKKELRMGVADAPLEEQLKLHEREAVNPINTPEQIEAVKQNIADIKKEIIAEKMAKVDSMAKAASSKPGIGENFEAQKIDLEGKISNINDKLSKSKSVTEKAQLGKQKKQYEQRIKAIERNLAIRDKAMGDIQKVQKVADTAIQRGAGSSAAPKPAPAPAPRQIRDVAPGDKPPINETFRTPDPAPSAATPSAATTQTGRPDYLQIERPKLDFQKMFERTENLLKQLKEHKASLTAPEESVNKLELTLERALRELGNENPDAYNKAFARVDLAEEIEQTKSLIITNDEEIANAKTPREAARLKKLNDTLERALRDLKRGKTELYDTKIGELSIKEYGDEMPTSSKIAERLKRVNIADESLGSYLDLPKPASPPASQPSSARPDIKTPPGSAPSPPPSAPGTPAEYAELGGLEPMPEGAGSGSSSGTSSGTSSRGSSRSMESIPEDVMSTLRNADYTQTARADPLDIDINDTYAGDIPSPRGTGGNTPEYPYDTKAIKRPKPADRGGPSSSLEMEDVPLIDSAGTSAATTSRPAPSAATTPAPAPAPAPAPGPKGKIGKGRAKIDPMKAPASATAPKPRLNFGRGTDVNIQGGRNNLVSSEFMNSTAGRASTSIRGLVSRAPTLKAPSASTLKMIGIEGGKMGVGIGVGIGVSYLMAQYFKAHPATDRFSQIGQQYAVGFSGAAAGNIVMRALAIAGRMGAKKVLTTTGMKILVVEGVYATRDAAAFVAVQLGVEIGTEALMDRYKFNHTTSKTTAAVAGSVVGIAMGMKEGGPFGAVLMAMFSAVSVTEAWFEGQEEDRMEEENKRATAETANKVNSARLVLVRNMKLVDNDYDRAFAMLSPTQKKNIYLVGNEGAENFKNSLLVEFNPLEKERNGNPYAPKDPEESPMERGFFQGVEVMAYMGSPAAILLNWQEKTFQENEAREQAAKDKYYSAYVQWHIDKKDSKNWNLPPPPEDEGFRLLERDTLGSWRTSAEFSGELAYEQTQNYNRVINAARTQILDEWHNDMTLIEDIQHRDQTGRDLVDTAGLDVDFFKDYETYIIQDATSQLAVQFNHFGINYRDADQRLVDVAGRDPSVLPALDHYYEVMTQLSAETGLPVAELARLDSLPKDQQERELGKVNSIRERVIREGLNNDKALVDEFNANLIRDMQSYGDNFEAIMNNINTQQMLMGYSYLYGTNRTDFYRQLHLEAPVVVIPPNPYAAGTEFDYDKNRTPGDTLIYGYRYNLTDEQNQELENYLYYKNRELYQKGDTKGRLTTADAMAKAAEIYDRDIAIYRKSDEEVAKDNNMTLDEYYTEYGYDKGKAPPPEPIEWQDITERPSPPTIINDESNEGAGQRAANDALQASRIAGGGTADEFDRISTSAYQNSLRIGEGGDIPQPGTNENGETINQENDPNGP